MIGATLCSGIGAPECAAPWIDWRWHAEIEAFPAAVHAVRFPGSVNLGDMTAPDLVERAAAIALPDVIVAGTPCQAFSLAGTRGSLADARGNLTLLFVRICNAIDDLRRAAGLAPLWIVWENVPGVFSTADNAFGSFVAGMVGGDAPLEPPRGRGWTDAGVVSGPERCAAWRVLDAQHFGLAQRRRRVFVLARGGAGSWAGADALLPVIEGMRWHPAPRREAGKGSAICPTLRAGGNSTGGERPPGTDVDTVESLIVGALRHTDGGSDVDHARAGHVIPLGLDTYVAHTLRGEGFDATEDGSGRGTPLVPVGFTQNSRGEVREIGGDGSIVGALAAEPGAQQQNYVAFNARQDTISSETVSGSLGSSHPQAEAIASAAAVRRLTPRECERLQGFPDDWTLVEWRGKPAADGPRYKALGNSMAVPVMRYLLERIRAVSSSQPPSERRDG